MSGAGTGLTRTGVVGHVREDEGHGTVRVESRYATTPEDLWEALTDPSRLARWLGDFSGDLRVGGTFDAALASSWTGTGVVEVCERPRRLRARMTDDEGETVVEATLVRDGDGVLLVVEERGLPLGGLPAYGAGWQVHLEDLGHHLEGTPRVAFSARWRELVEGYRAAADAPAETVPDAPRSP